MVSRTEGLGWGERTSFVKGWASQCPGWSHPLPYLVPSPQSGEGIPSAPTPPKSWLEKGAFFVATALFVSLVG